MHSNVELLVINRKGLAFSTSQFAKAAAMISSCEEHTGLSRALSQLTDVEEKVKYHNFSFFVIGVTRNFLVGRDLGDKMPGRNPTCH